MTDQYLDHLHGLLRRHITSGDWAAFDDDLLGVLRLFLRERDEARARLAALADYIDHQPQCQLLANIHVTCTCGLDAVLRASDGR